MDEWLDSLPTIAGNAERGQWLAGQLREVIETKERTLRPSRRKRLPASLTFDRTARRSFEIQYWKNIAFLSGGKYINKANADCIQDPITQKRLKHHHRDLEALGDYLLAYYRRVIAAHGMQGKAFVGESPLSVGDRF